MKNIRIYIDVLFDLNKGNDFDLLVLKYCYFLEDYYYANKIQQTVNIGKPGRFRHRFQNHASNITHRKYLKRNYSTKRYILDNDIDEKGNFARLMILY